MDASNEKKNLQTTFSPQRIYIYWTCWIELVCSLFWAIFLFVRFCLFTVIHGKKEFKSVYKMYVYSISALIKIKAFENFIDTTKLIYYDKYSVDALLTS